jgi:hypothetical protein
MPLGDQSVGCLALVICDALTPEKVQRTAFFWW